MNLLEELNNFAIDWMKNKSEMNESNQLLLFPSFVSREEKKNQNVRHFSHTHAYKCTLN